MIMVQNPVANLEDSELPNLTEHVPVAPKDFATTQDEKKEAFDDCEIYLPKRQKKKLPVPPDNVLTEGTDMIRNEKTRIV